jgi:hypothetical protein
LAHIPPLIIVGAEANAQQKRHQFHLEQAITHLTEQLQTMTARAKDTPLTVIE